MLRLTVKTSGVRSESQIRSFVEREFRRAMTAIVDLGKIEIARNTPVGATRKLLSGLYGKVISPTRVEFGVKGTAGRYVDFAESGRKPGKFPPLAAIELWVKRTDKGKRLMAAVKRSYNIKNDAQALKQATFLKARAIARRGTRGAFMFKKALPKIKQQAQTSFKAAVKRIEKALV